MKNRRIVICGPAGTGKSTVARAISEEFGIKYVSGSLYDLMPNLPKNHYDLNTKYDTNEKHKRNFQILNLRYHQYMELEGSFVTDRSLYDTAGYEIQENSLGLPTCETHDFIEKINVKGKRDNPYYFHSLQKGSI